MNKSIRRATASLAAAASLISVASPAAFADQVPAAVSAPAAAPLAPEGQDMAQQTRQILDALRVNTAPPPAIRPTRDRSVTLTAGSSAVVTIPIGGSRSISLPGPFERAVVVVPEVADIVVTAPGRAQIMARAAGATDIVFTTATGETFRAHVQVSVDTAPVQAALNAALQGERIIATAVNGSVVLSGTTRDATAAATAVSIARRFVADPANGIVNRIMVTGGQQVMLRVRVAEVSRSAVRQLGLNSAIGSFGHRNGGGSGVNQLFGNQPGLAEYGYGSPGGTNNAAGGLQPLLALAAAGSNPVGFLSMRALGGVLTTTMNALEGEGLVRTLAEPNLVAMSGRTANFLAGAQYPVPTVGMNGTVGTEYRPFGVSLSFTPTVMSATSIGLELATEVSARGESVAFPVGNSVASIPSFTTRRANTTVELPSGGSIVIAGLMTNEFTNSLESLPGVRDIPILGKLFSSANFQRRESELVIVVQAFLVEPTDNAARPSVPTDGLTPPSNADLYLLHRLTGIGNRPRSAPPPGVERNFGYITE